MTGDQDKASSGPSDRLVLALMDRMVEYVWTMDMDMRFTYVSPAVEKVSGYTPEELMDMSIEDIVPAGSLEEALGILGKELEAEAGGDVDPDRIRILEMKGRRKDGSEMWTEVNVRFLRDDRGEPVGLLGITRDITSKRQAEEDSRAKTQALTERIKEMECVNRISELTRDPTKDIREILRRAVEIIGSSFQFTDVCCARMRYKDLVFKSPSWKDTGWTIGTDIVTKGEVSGRIDVCYLEERPFLPEERSLLDTIGRMLGHTFERRAAEEALKESEDRYRKLFEISPDGIAVLSLDGAILDSNDVFLRMTDRAREDLIGSNFTTISKMSEEELEEYGELFMKMLEGEKVDNFEMEWAPPGKKKIWLEVIPGLLKKGGEVTALQVILRDVTERKAELERQKSMVVTLEEEKRRLEEMLRPRAEKPFKPGMESMFEPGHSYIILEPDHAGGTRHFLERVFYGHHGLFITRRNPAVLRKRHQLEKTPFIWLTSNEHEGEICIKPSNIQKLASAITSFLDQTDKGTVLFTGIEYLATQNGFRSLINLLYLLNDKVMMSDDILLLSVNPKAYLPQDLQLLTSEFTVVGALGEGGQDGDS
jgi:PAS domain S-box-containing protein